MGRKTLNSYCYKLKTKAKQEKRSLKLIQKSAKVLAKKDQLNFFRRKTIIFFYCLYLNFFWYLLTIYVQKKKKKIPVTVRRGKQ